VTRENGGGNGHHSGGDHDRDRDHGGDGDHGRDRGNLLRTGGTRLPEYRWQSLPEPKGSAWVSVK